MQAQAAQEGAQPATGTSEPHASRLPRQRRLRDPVARGAPRRRPRGRRRSSPSPTGRRAAAAPWRRRRSSPWPQRARPARPPAATRPRARGVEALCARWPRAAGRRRLRPDPARSRDRHPAARHRQRARLAAARATAARRRSSGPSRAARRETGVTTMLIDEGLDTGPTPARPRDADRRRGDGRPSWSARLARLGAEVLVETLARPGCAAALRPAPQDHARATLAPILRRRTGASTGARVRDRDRAPRSRLPPLARHDDVARRAARSSCCGRARTRPARAAAGHGRSRVDRDALVVACGDGTTPAPARGAAREPAAHAARPPSPPARASSPARASTSRRPMPTPRDGSPSGSCSSRSRPARTLAERLAAPDADALDPRERAFLHELVLGTLRRRGDARPCAGRAPRSAARRGSTRPCSPPCASAPTRSCTCASPTAPPCRSRSSWRARRRPARPGFVNAVLRRLARGRRPAAARPRARPARLAHDRGLAARAGWPSAGSRDWAPTAPSPARARSSTRRRVVFRLNPRVPDALDRVRAAGTSCRARWRCPARGEASRRAATRARSPRASSTSRTRARSWWRHLAAVRAGRVLDACAAPGGKATLLADAGGAAVRVVAGEASRTRLRDAWPTLAARWGAPNVRVLGADALRPPFATAFDAVLLDAPCSGSARSGATPTSAGARAPADLERQAQRQRELLAALSRPLVAPGGRLVYATCSSSPRRTRTSSRRSCPRTRSFRSSRCRPGRARFADGHFARTRPERDGGDAFFAAVLRRGLRRLSRVLCGSLTVRFGECAARPSAELSIKRFAILLFKYGLLAVALLVTAGPQRAHRPCGSC